MNLSSLYKRCALSHSIFLVMGLFFVGPAKAAPFQTPGDIDYIRERQQRILQEQQKKLQELQDLPTQQPSQPKVEPQATGYCFTIKSITLKGITLISKTRQDQLIALFINQCVGIEQLNELLKIITDEYLNKGYVTSRAYLPEQDLSTGELIIQVVEGKLEGFKASDVASHAEVYMASPSSQGKAINLRDLEQAVEQLNRLPSRRVEIELLPGEEVGSSYIQLKGQKTKPWHVNLNRNNDGQKSTGEQQWAASLLWDSPLGLADQVSLSAGGDAVSDHWRHTDNQSINYNLPFGYWNFNYSYSQSYYRSRTHSTDGFSFDMDGESKTHRFSMDRVIYRDSVSKAGISAGISHLRTRNYIDDVLLDVSSQRLTSLDLGINYGRRINNAYLNMDLGWQQGIGALDAQSNRHAGHGNPDARYDKYTLTVSYLHPFQIQGEYFSFESLANGQYSHDVLFSPQRISLGGSSSIRGFKEQSLSGDSGGYWRNQIRWRKGITWEPLQKIFQEYGALFAYDVGVIRHSKYNPEYSGRMSGNALEFNVSGQYVSAAVTFARSLKSPHVIERKEHPVYFRVDVNF
ncbi:ShlB/FhaC/HecB family hemolysin secretion/activation protein [Entomomonas moraniae]|uniref:ShlB/FhaC/HecB family hemolysin secretion/activation protein n=1 Tax=Entomomonas moraniae TaxID=2213226 RepID=A0A3Q9JK63_9GAMM|nr:ShlB/FhaC/HecB family hemolysin secretion/activation protein [Entomomonas moraniae]